MIGNKLVGRAASPSPFARKPFGGLDTMSLRLLALGLMLLRKRKMAT